MTFSELLDITVETQKVRVYLTGVDEIEGSADTLNCFLKDEIMKTDVLNIEAEDGVLKVFTGVVMD